jgi:thiamine-phosphate diphosphorylase
MAPHAPRLLLVTPQPVDLACLLTLLPRLHGVADAVVLRWPQATDRERTAACARLAAVRPRPMLLSSDRFDIAVACGLDGVQLRDAGLPPARVRALCPRLAIGVSRHATTAGLPCGGADWMVVAPIFPTPSKPGSAALGIAGLAAICRRASVPVLGLGGVTPELAPALRGAGAWGAAASSAVFGAPDPAAAAILLRAALLGGAPGR